MLKMVDGTGIIGVDMVCPLGGTVSPPQPPNFDKVEVEGVGSLMLPNSLKAPIERLELIGNSVQGENPAPDNPQEIKSAGKWNKATGKYEIDIILNGSNLWKEDSMIRGHLTTNGEIVYKEDDSNCIWTVVTPRDGKYAVRIEKESVGGLYFTKIFNDKTLEPYVRLNPGQKGILTLKKGENKIQASSTSALRPTGNEKVMLSYGDQEPPTYEAYQEPQTFTLTSDRPLTKWDRLVEQGGQYGWLYQSVIDSNVKPSRTDLFPNGFSLFKDFGNGVYVYKVTNIKKAIGFQTSLCEQFKNKDGSYSAGDLFCYSDQPSMQMQYFVTDIPTLEEFKTWMEANSLTMVYKTTQAEFTPLSESEQTQLRNLHSYNGTTNITVDSGEVPCGIKLTYRKEI